MQAENVGHRPNTQWSDGCETRNGVHGVICNLDIEKVGGDQGSILYVNDVILYI